MINLNSLIITEKFYKILDQCKGSVLLPLPDGTVCDLRKDSTALQILKMADLSQKPVNIQISSSQDFSLFLTYMLEATSSETPAKPRNMLFHKIWAPKKRIFAEYPESAY